MTPRRRLAFLALALAPGCADDVDRPMSSSPPPPFDVQPSHVSSFGYTTITVRGDMSKLGPITDVVVGGVRAIDVTPIDDGLTATVQGTAMPGPAAVALTGTLGTIASAVVLTYDPPQGRAPLRWMAFGASLTAGAQSGGMSAPTQEQSPAAQVARAAGVYMSLPVLNGAFGPPLTTNDFNPDCSQKPGTGLDPSTALVAITDPDTKQIDVRRARLDPTLPLRNVAVPGSKVAETVHGTKGGFTEIVEHVLEPFDNDDPSKIFAPINTSQLDHVESIDPDVAFSFDLLGNDLDGAVVATDDLHPEKMTPLDKVLPDLTELAMRLGKLHGHFFLASMPSLTFAPNVEDLRQKRLAAGEDPQIFAAKLKTIEDLTAAYNVAFAQTLAPYPNLHLVDLPTEVDRVKMGVVVGGETLTVQKFGGLLSLDFLHFTNTGYALLANLVLARVNEVLALGLPLVDIEAVHRDDPLSPAKLRAAGLLCVPQ